MRELAKNGFADYRLPLTPEGIDMAREWGSQLARPVDAFFSSPVGRCVNTAKAMAEGARKAGLLETIPEITTDTTLVEPGLPLIHILRLPRIERRWCRGSSLPYNE